MKTFWVVIISVILTAGVVGGGVWYFLDQQATQDKNNLNTQISDLQTSLTKLKTTATSTTTIPTTTDATASWKTYTSDAFKYSIKYPSNWFVTADGNLLSVNSPENQAIRDQTNAYNEGYAPTILIQYFASVSDYVNQGTPQVKSTKMLLEFIQGEANKNTLNEITLGGQKAYEYEAGGFAGNYYYIACEYTAKVYSTQIVSEKSALTATEKLILSTFQFTK